MSDVDSIETVSCYLIDGRPVIDDCPVASRRAWWELHSEVVRIAQNPLRADSCRAAPDHLVEIRKEFPMLRVPSEQALDNPLTLIETLRSCRGARIERAIDEHVRATELISRAP